MKIIINLIRKVKQYYWKHRFGRCGDGFVCCFGVVICHAKNIDVGNIVRVGEKSFINAKGGLKIGNNVHIGPRVTIFTSNHDYYAPKALPFYGDIDKKVIIEDNVWVGACASIVPGVTIGEGAVIGMSSVVTKDVPPCAVVGGNPAKILKYRDKEVYYKLKTNYD